MNAKRAILRGVAPSAVLLLLADGEMSSYDLAQALARGGPDMLPIGEGAAYALLLHLESRKVIKSRLNDKSPHAEPMYRLTDRGQRRLDRESRRHADLSRVTKGES